MLYVTTAKNENWTTTDVNKNTTVEYKDFAGRVVLKKSYITETDAASTAYVYDDMGRLRYVLPPLAMDATSVTTDVINNLCFSYKYDERGRMIEKRLPGAGPVYMVYDNRDRLVLTQDGVQRTRTEWSFTKYDGLNRPIMTGTEVYPTGTRATLQSTASASVTFAESLAANTTGYTIINTFPVLDAPVTFEILNITYFDGYDFDNNGVADYTYQTVTGYTNTPVYNLTGNVIGTRTKILGTTSTYQTSVTFYDKYNHAIQTRADNYLSGQDVVTSEFAFSGEVKKTNHQQSINGTVPTITTDERFVYDHARRLKESWLAINSAAEVNTTALAYNELGQLVTKKLHASGATYAQKVDYTYNIRGWLKTINNPDDLLPTTENDAFGMRLLYNDVSAITATGVTPTVNYNGNIAGTIWQNSTDKKLAAYSYGYDALNRINSGNYAEKVTDWAILAGNGYSENGIQYDKNGNIKKLDRYNKTALMDNLTYDYGSGATQGNILLGIEDASSKTEGFLDKVSSASEYGYDANGNLTRDDNKGITAIEYNILNLPKKVTFASDKYIEYMYNADGEKLAKKVTNGATVTWNYYVGNVEYDSNKNFVLLGFGEGRITKPSGSYTFEYFITDHLGNTRAIVKQDQTVLQAVNYYPFGLTHSPVNPDNDNQYLYNGKEIQKDFAFLSYDFNHRYYDPLICRFTTQDGLAEKFSHMSPYQYGSNNPSTLIELDGLEGIDPNNGDLPDIDIPGVTVYPDGSGGGIPMDMGNNFVNIVFPLIAPIDFSTPNYLSPIALYQLANQPQSNPKLPKFNNPKVPN